MADAKVRRKQGGDQAPVFKWGEVDGFNDVALEIPDAPEQGDSGGVGILDGAGKDAAVGVVRLKGDAVEVQFAGAGVDGGAHF